MEKYDLIVIGSGPAGEKAAVKAAYFGHKVALIEKAGVFGGAGVNTGTLPSKTLKETPLYFSGKYDKGLYGIDRDLDREASINDFMYRKDRVLESAEHEVFDNLRRHGVTVYQGPACFDNPHHVRVTGLKEELIEGQYIIIATGSYPVHPPGMPFDGIRVHDSDTILSIKRFPKSLCVVGAGVIGCEYATIFSTMGVKVFLINRTADILPFIDREICQHLLEQMQAGGVEMLFNANVKSIHVPTSDEELLDIELDTGVKLHVDMFLYAAGRNGNTKSLKCENVGLTVGNREQISVNHEYRTVVPHIFAVGDVIGFPALASTSMDQGRVAVAHIFQTNDLESISQVLPYGIYTVPEVSTVGVTEEEVKKEGLDYEVGRAWHKDMARGRIMGAKGGMLKVIFTKQDRVIRGVHVIGPLASELIHYGVTLVKSEQTLMHVISTVFNFPTLHDLYKYACYDGLSNLSGHNVKRSG